MVVHTRECLILVTPEMDIHRNSRHSREKMITFDRGEAEENSNLGSLRTHSYSF